jgi:X-Pro dipeptidyl-peptidase
VRNFRRTRRYSTALVGAGVLAAAILPATSQAQPNDDDLPIDQWPATDIFYDENGQPTISPEYQGQLGQPAGAFSPFLAPLAEPDEIVIEDGVTQPVFSYQSAIREAVRVPSSVDSDDDGEVDMIYVDIIRPAASDDGLDVPTIIIPSPYYHGTGRGRLGELKQPPVRAQVVVGETTIDGRLMTPEQPLAGQAGTLVDCGLAIPDTDPCPAEVAGNIALVERGSATFVSKINHAADAGALAVVMYNDRSGPLASTVTGVPISSVGITRDEGLGLLEQMAEGDVEATLSSLAAATETFPLYYDNYFVPRGYAVAMIDLAGTRGSTGCLDEGEAEVQGAKKVVEWLAGNHIAYDLDGNEVAADWSNGLSGMTGKSWDGTVTNGVAATGVEGLATIVPIAGISSWYHWHFHNGLRFNGHTSFSLTNSIQGTNSTMPGWQDRCSDIRAEMAANQDNGDPESAFWSERDFIKDADQVEASVFVVHGLNDYNVKPINYGEWWDALAANDVPRKIWLAPVAHEKAFDFRRDEWLDTIHRWYDHWLHGIENGIMDEPMADVDQGVNDWVTYDTWPGGTSTLLRFGQPDDAEDPRLGVLDVGALNDEPASQTFEPTRRNITSNTSDGFEADDERLVFMTDELSEDVRISGETTISLRATSAEEEATFSAYLVDYGTATRTNYDSGGGVGNLPTITCFGQGTELDTGCYPDVERNTRTRDFEIVARGWASATHVTGEEALVPGEPYRIEWDVMTDDWVFPEGHRIGIVIAGADTSIHFSHNNSGNLVEVHLSGSHVKLPVVGGANAFRDATN